MKEIKDEMMNQGDTDKATRFRTMLSCIDKDMVIVKLTYFLWSGLVDTYTIYFNPFCVSIGIPKHKAGIITGLPHAVSVIAAPLWGILTDYIGHQQFVIVVLCLVSAIWVPSIPLIAESVSRSNEMSNGNTIFLTVVIITALGSVFFSCVDKYVEAIALMTIKASPRGATYGSQRIFGSIGGSIITYSMGVLQDHSIIKDMSPYAIVFFTYPIFPLLLLPLMLFLLIQQKKWMNTPKGRSDSAPLLDSLDNPSEDNTGKDDPDEVDRNILKEFATLFLQMDVIIFMITVLISGLADSLLYFMVFLINEKVEVSKSKVSLVFSMEAISNLVAFFCISRIMKLLGGPIPTIIISLLCFCFRYILTSYIKSYWGIIALQGLSGLSFGSIWCSFMEYVHMIAPTKIKTTMIVLMQSIHSGLGTVIGTTVGGIICEMYDATRLMRWTGIMCGLWSCFLIVYYSIKHFRNIFNHDLKD